MIKDSELDIFERGSPSDLQLNFAIFLFSMAATGFAALVTGTFPNDSIRTGFIVAVVVGLLLGSYLLFAWFRNRRSSQEMCALIRQRIKETSIIEASGPVSPDTTSGEMTKPKE
jgi:hypothetical protein